MPQTKVSIVIPTFGRSDLLPLALRSVQAQTLTDWEAIIVDDNPPQSDARADVEALIAAFGEPRFRLLRNDRNRGAQYSRNHGLREARGEWVAFLDDDDTWLPTKLERQLALTTQSALAPGFIGCAWAVIGEDAVLHPRCTPQLRGDASDALELNRIGPLSILLARRELLLRVGGLDERFTHRQDLDLYLRLAFETPFDWCDEVLVHHLEHPHRKSRQPRGRLDAHHVFHRRWRTYIEDSPARRASFYARLGELHLACGERREAARWFLRSLRSRPASPRVLARLVLTPFGAEAFRQARRLRKGIGRS